MIPDRLQLPAKAPEAVKAYRRRGKWPATNVPSATEFDFVNIYPDTSTPGAFLDPTSTCIELDLNITNNCPFVDYTDFGKGGVGGAIFHNYRVFNQGSIMEEILDYGTAYETYAHLSGYFELETHMYVSSRCKVTYQMENHKNFIKPPMINNQNNIMWGPNPQGLGFGSTTSYGTQYQNAADVANKYACMQVRSAYGAADISGYGGGAPSYNLNIAATEPSWTKPTAVYKKQITPMDWPELFDPDAVEPCLGEYVQMFGSMNKPMIMANLCNVKCFPIGMKAARNAYNNGLADSTLAPPTNYGSDSTATAPIAYTVTYRCQIPILSGIFGMLAPKFLATCLLSPQQLYMNIQLASAAVALTVSADPCRRLPGTTRDYVRNVGTQNGAKFGDVTFYPVSAVNGQGANAYLTTPYDWEATTTAAPGYVPGISIPPNAEANAIYNADSCNGRLISTMGTAIWLDTGNTTGTLGESKIKISGDFPVTGANQVALAVGNFIAPIPGVLSNGAYITGFYTQDANKYVLIDRLLEDNLETPVSFFSRESVKYPAPATPQYVLAQEPWKYKGSGVSGEPIYYAAETVCFYGTYLPESVPQTARIFQMAYNNDKYAQTNVISNYSSDKGVISYTISNINLVGDQIILPDSVTADIVKQAASGGYNVQTNSVRTYVLQPSSSSSTQNIICPFKISRAKRALFVFQANDTRNSSTGFYYNSNSGFNPFASISYSTSTRASLNGYVSNATGGPTPLYGVGYQDPLTYQPTPINTLDSAINVQLTIGSEHLPQQPMTTMSEIAYELNKAMKGWMDNAYSPSLDAKVVNVNGIAAYDCLRPNQFTTAFVHNNLLNDQTITQNTDMAPLYCYSANLQNLNSASTIKSAAATVDSSYNGLNYLAPRGYCVPHLFKPPSSSFVLGFDLSPFAQSDGVTTGTYLGNNTITLKLQGAVGLANPMYTSRIVAVIPHVVVMRYAAGGQLIWNY